MGDRLKELFFVGNRGIVTETEHETGVELGG